MSHVARKVIQQYSKQRQSRNAVCSQNPRTAAFAMGYRRLRTAYICRGITQGPIFHANLRGRKVVAREASHFTPHCRLAGVDGANVTTKLASCNREMAVICKIQVKSRLIEPMPSDPAGVNSLQTPGRHSAGRYPVCGGTRAQSEQRSGIQDSTSLPAW